MSQFMPEPSAVLDREQTLTVIKSNNLKAVANGFEFRVKSQWLCDEIDAYEKTGKYPYNSDVMRAIEAKEGLPRYDDSGSALSTLVYNAQRYRRHDQLIRDGFAPLTEAMVRDAIARKAKVEVAESSLIDASINGVKVEPERKLYRPAILPTGGAFVFAPRSKTRGYRADGTKPAKIV